MGRPNKSVSPNLNFALLTGIIQHAFGNAHVYRFQVALKE